ncbi:hypothetical protein DICVIV_14002 [Dictyocaulus viviparus]|uniref:Uncharacterized protein n=1 Tax=Dictyocaulus viviparus TaxID=29172 RepID=A0A0D8X6A5_DICVI|nr:hypothetical protein DICVIV_14002 [Dictyocaulus viviparus]
MSMVVSILTWKTINCGDKTDNGFRSYVERFHRSGGRYQVEWNCDLEKQAKRLSKGCPKNLPLFWKGRSISGSFDLNVEVKSKVVLARQILNSWFYGDDSFQVLLRFVCMNEADFLPFSLTSTFKNHGRLFSV